MDKMKMELVRHNCKTCPPSEELNTDLTLIWRAKKKCVGGLT